MLCFTLDFTLIPLALAYSTTISVVLIYIYIYTCIIYHIQLRLLFYILKWYEMFKITKSQCTEYILVNMHYITLIKIPNLWSFQFFLTTVILSKTYIFGIKALYFRWFLEISWFDRSAIRCEQHWQTKKRVCI